MPKNRKAVKIGNFIKKLKVASKLRIGTRKAGTSAYLMSTEALKEVLGKADSSKWHQNARTVLASRGVTA